MFIFWSRAIYKDRSNVNIFFLRWLNYIIFAFVAEVRLTLYNSFIVFVFLLNFLFCIGVQPVNNVVMVSGEQRRDSAIHTHVCILPQLPSHPGCHVTLSRAQAWRVFWTCKRPEWLGKMKRTAKWAGTQITQNFHSLSKCSSAHLRPGAVPAVATQW